MSTRFGKFRLLQPIGGGRLSPVFRVARPLSDGPPPRVALKRVNPAFIGQPDYVKLVVREAGLLTRLEHPNLCACGELGVIDGCPFLTLDLVEGCTLRALMRTLSRQGVKLPASAITALGAQLAAVLDYLHRRCERPLIHLDLSPQNVMVSVEGTLKLIDFGIARFCDGDDPPPVGERIAGTIGYMSPEQARGDALECSADQFGLGILLWEMLAGRRLFRGNTGETWRRMRRGQTPPAREALAEAPEELRRTVTRLLEPEPEERFPDLAAALESLSGGGSAVHSGRKPLAALVQRLMADPEFDPFDVRLPREAEPPAADIPRGEALAEEYAELSIEVDQGAGTPGSLVRSLVTTEVAEPPPSSPFLELGDEATGEILPELAQ